ncbi:MAG: hypothetical protein WD648_00485 [Planctomycetaceae bacterium]
METFYMYCAAIGGTLMAGQFILGVLGFGHDHGFDAGGAGAGLDHAGIDHGDFDNDGQWFVGMLSFRAIVAAVTVFGLTGLAVPQWFDSPKPQTVFLIGLAAGGAVMYGIAWLMRMVYRLKSDGTVRIDRAVGARGSVYLTIPGNKSGAGKVNVTVQGRTMEYQAITSEGELPTGAAVVVVDVAGPGTLEVSKAAATNSA